MTKYRLHRYFYSSRPVFPLIISMCFLGVMYSTKPTDLCSSYEITGIFQFVLLTFVAFTMNGKEEKTEEQLLLLHGNGWRAYCLAREMNLVVISAFYGVLLSGAPVILNVLNYFGLFTRALTVRDAVMGTMIVLGSGLAGIAIGDVFHPRIVSDRKIAISLVVVALVFSIAKDAMVEECRFLSFLNFFLPSVMMQNRDSGNVDFFKMRSTIAFILMIGLYYLVVALIKNLMLYRKRFS